MLMKDYLIECMLRDTTLLVNVWAIAHNPPSRGPDTLEFMPARFPVGGSYESGDVKGTNYKLIPYGQAGGSVRASVGTSRWLPSRPPHSCRPSTGP